MGAAHQGAAAARLLRERAARRDGGGLARHVWHLFRYDGRPGVCLARWRRQLVGDRARSAAGALRRGADAVTIRVELPTHLKTLAGVADEVALQLPDGVPVTQRAVLDALEARYPVLRGTMRDHDTLRRRPFVRFFACARDQIGRA